MTEPDSKTPGPPSQESAASRNLDDFARRAGGFDRKILEDEARHFERAVEESFPRPEGPLTCPRYLYHFL
jgi:hypothetical protein